MKKTPALSLLALTLVSACHSPEEPKATSSPLPTHSSPSGGRQYGEALKGGIDKAKEMQEKMDHRIQRLNKTAEQHESSRDK